MKKNHFADVEETERPFSVFGYVDNGKYYGNGWDGVGAQNICGYLYRDGDMLYTKILVSSLSDKNRLFDISNALQNGHFDADAEIVAEKIATLIKNSVPEYLLGDWRFANSLANLPILDAVVERLIELGLLTPPEDGIGAEGCWMSVEK